MSEEIKQKASWAVPWENQLNELLEEKIQDVYNAGSKYLYVYDNTTETYTSCGSEIHLLLNKELGDFINSLLSQALQKRDEQWENYIAEQLQGLSHTADKIENNLDKIKNQL